MCALISAALLAVALLVRLFRRPILRWKLRRLLKDRPGVDLNDPELHERAVATFNNHGFSTKGTGTFHEVAWSVVRELVETRTLLILMVGKRIGFIVPKRDLSLSDTAVIGERARERSGRAE